MSLLAQYKRREAADKTRRRVKSKLAYFSETPQFYILAESEDIILIILDYTDFDRMRMPRQQIEDLLVLR